MHIVLITRHYPPEISGGARRPMLYTQALRSMGHQVTLVTPFDLDDENSITIKNPAIERGISALANSDTISTTPHGVKRMKDRLRVWRYWPDDNRPWVDDVITALKDKDWKPDWIMTTSPPESIHFAGAALSKAWGVPWLAEMRDTWVEMPHRKILIDSPMRAKLETRMAKTVFRQAHAITAVSEAVMQEGRKYVPPSTPEIIISHFSDPPDEPHSFSSSRLNLVHTGGFTLSDRRRKLGPLLDILRRAALHRSDIALHIAGPLSADETELLNSTRIKIVWHGSVSLETARAMQVGADGLILHTPENSHALPGKYAEYAMTGRPILYLGSGDWMKLVENPSQLLPLEETLKTLEKGLPPQTPYGLTHLDAAKKLDRFLMSCAPSHKPASLP